MIFRCKWTRVGQYDHAIQVDDPTYVPVDADMVDVSALFGAEQIAQIFPDTSALSPAERLAWFYGSHKLWLSEDGRLFFFTDFAKDGRPANAQPLSSAVVFDMTSTGEVVGLARA